MVSPLSQRIVFPPLAISVTALPLHNSLSPSSAAIAESLLCPIVILAVFIQPLSTSVITTVYIPDCVTIIFLVKSPVSHAYVYVPTPTFEVITTWSIPQVNSAKSDVSVIAGGDKFSSTTTVSAALQPFTFVTVKVYVPGFDTEICAVVSPVFHSYVKVVSVETVPSTTTASLQVIDLGPPASAIGTFTSCVITISFDFTGHPFAPSVTVTKYVPSDATAISAVVSPVLHK